MTVTELKTLSDDIRSEIGKAIIGQEDSIDLLLVALFSGGHVLLEGPPGTAKTFLAQCFSATLSLDFGRIQFTPDLMPGDVLGTNLFNFQTNTFSLTKGPIFSEILLADEINRTPPKTQAALLEAMQERRVTIDGETHDLSPHFMVVATQNPIEQQGTYPLPEAQLDRFLFKHLLTYPSREEELKIVMAYGQRSGMARPADLGVQSVVDSVALEAAFKTVADVKLTEDIVAYIVDLIRGTRDTTAIETGASARAAAALATAARARAALDGRDFVIPDDVKTLALPALRHRIVLSPAAEIEGRDADAVIGSIIDQTPAPR